jgi:hypothetical protein
VGIGFPAQQCIRINGGAMHLVAELDAAKITLGTLFAGLWSTKAFARL